MDGVTFDKLARQVITAANRRSFLTGLAGAGWFGIALTQVEDAPAKRRKRKKKKPKVTCTPDARSKTCQGRCGSVLNNCRQAVQCGNDCPICTRRSGQGACVREAAGTAWAMASRVPPTDDASVIRYGVARERCA
jgi:hypothetical protein